MNDLNETTEKFKRQSSHLGEFDDEVTWTFDDVIGMVRTALAGVGIIAMIVITGFVYGSIQ